MSWSKSNGSIISSMAISEGQQVFWDGRFIWIMVWVPSQDGYKQRKLFRWSNIFFPHPLTESSDSSYNSTKNIDEDFTSLETKTTTSLTDDDSILLNITTHDESQSPSTTSFLPSLMRYSLLVTNQQSWFPAHDNKFLVITYRCPSFSSNMNRVSYTNFI